MLVQFLLFHLENQSQLKHTPLVLLCGKRCFIILFINQKSSNVETCFHMIKSKFGDGIRSKDETAQINEVLAKVLCHNICVVIQEIHELGIKGEFTAKKEVKE